MHCIGGTHGPMGVHRDIVVKVLHRRGVLEILTHPVQEFF